MKPIIKSLIHVAKIIPFTMAFFSSPQSTAQGNCRYIHTEANIWQLEVSSDAQFVTADYHGNVSLRNRADGSEIWSYNSGSFVFDLKTGDLDKNGTKEVAFVNADGDLIVLDNTGNVMWKFETSLPIYNVGIGNFQGDAGLELVCGGIDRHVYVLDSKGKLITKSQKVERLVHRIAVGKLTQKAYDQILVIENRVIAHLIDLQGDSLTTIYRKTIEVPDHMVNWENPRGSFFPFSITIDDIDMDGFNEILMGDTFFNKQSVMVSNANCESLWISDGIAPFKFVDNAQTEFYSTAFVRASDVFPHVPGKEIVSIAGGLFRIWDNIGNLLGISNSEVGFTDFELSGNNILLASSPNGDEYIYEFNFGDQWQETVKNIQFQGKIKQIKQDTENLHKLVRKYNKPKEQGQVYDLYIELANIKPGEQPLDEYRKGLSWFKTAFPYQNLRPVASVKVIEQKPPLDHNGKPWSLSRWKVDAINGTMTVDEIIKIADFIEKNKIATLFNIGHSCMPFITLETAEKILQTAPNYCVGFISMEDEAIDKVPDYFQYYFKPLANLCIKYGNKKCITKNKGLWWMTAPTFPEVFDALFMEGRDRVSVAATEDSNSRTPELNLMARGGLWQAGYLKNNDVSIHADLFSFNRFQQWEYPRAGFPYLRLLIAHSTLGMTQVSSRIRDYIKLDTSYVQGKVGFESASLFFHLLGKGIVISPQKNQSKGYSSLGLVVHKPDLKWLKDAHNGHSPELWTDDPELHQAVIPHNGSLWGMTNTSDHALQKILFNKQRQFGYQVPPVPFGLIAIVPEHADLKKLPHVTEWLHTDGIYIWSEKDSTKISGEQAALKVRTAFEQAAKKLIFRQISTDPVFMQVIELKKDQYRLYLIDPGWLDPKAREVPVKIQMKGNFSAINTLSGDPIQVVNNDMKIEVPAGLFTIIDVKKE